MTKKDIHVVTGAFGYSGKYIAKRLLEAGHEVRTLTNSPNRPNPFGGQIKATPFHFENPEKLVTALQGTSVLYNTYWVRFNHRDFQHANATRNIRRLFQSAKEAGVKRVVHISITNPAEESHLEYFSGKAKHERALIDSGLSYAILRPAVIFGKEDILINNIAWILRRFPVFGIFGDGNYSLQPIFVDDLAELAVAQGSATEDCIIDAIGPETFTYKELVREIGVIIDKQRPIVSIPDSLGYILGWFLGKLQGDVLLTRDEIEGLKANLLHTNSPPVCETKLTDWARENSTTLGIKYASELSRRRERSKAYEDL
jgi:NADH dehydrogenase